jgi:hypothetical protein
MAAPLSLCTKEEQRAVMHCLWAEGVKGFEIHIYLCAQFGGESCLRKAGKV